MNKIIKSIVVAATASSLFMATMVHAEQKLAIVNFQEVMAKIPQTGILMSELENEIKDDKAIIVQLEKDIQYNKEKQKRDSSLMTKKEQDELNAKIASLFKEYQTKGQALNEHIAKRQTEESNKLIAIVRQVIDNIAKKGGYDLIIEQKAAAFAKPELDITAQVVENVSKLK